MITRAEAEAIARRKLKEIETEMGIPLALMPDGVVEREVAIAFSYNSKEFLEEGTFSARLAGNGPLIVLRGTGQILEAGTSEPVDAYLDNLERFGTLNRPSG